MLKLFLENHNFRSLTLFTTFGGIGHGMFSIFMMWAIHAMYQNPMYTGIAGFMFGAPMVAGFLVGPFVDRWDKVRVLRFAEFTNLFVVVLMLVSHLHLTVGVWFYFAAIFIFSASSMFSGPAHTALLPRVVDSDDLVKANAATNIFGIIGGLGLGAVLFALSDGELNFTRFYGIISALLFVASLFTFLLRYKESIGEQISSNESKAPLKTYLNELGEGFSFIKKGAMLFFAVAFMAMSFFSNVAYVNFPMFIDLRLGSASGYIMFSFLALMGGMIGSYICRMTEAKFQLWKILAVSFFIAGATRIAFVNVISDNFTRAIVMYLFYVGFGAVFSIFYRVLVQKLPPKNLTGRVYTASTSMTAAVAAVGALAGGLLGTLLYTDMVFFIQGGAYIVIGLYMCLVKHIRELSKISELGKNNGDSENSEAQEAVSELSEL